MTKKSTTEDARRDSHLTVPQVEVRAKLEERVASGREMLERSISSQPELEQLWRDYLIWNDYNAEFLSRIVDSDVLRSEYSDSIGIVVGYAHPSFEEVLEDRHDYIERNLTTLQSIMARLELMPERLEPAASSVQASSLRGASKRVFLVHGHDTGVLGSVEAFLRKLGLDVVILKDEPNKGQTIIEKVESNADVGFAVVLLTGDDEGHQRQMRDALVPRARQNVIFELGYFIGRLGRPRVCALYESGVELPSDYSGVTFIHWSEDESWKFLLLRELKAAGLPVNANDVL